MVYFILFSVLLLSGSLVYIYIKKKKYTRERYAFFATLSIFSYISMVSLHVFNDNSLFKIISELSNGYLGTSIEITQTTISAQAWSVLILIIICKFVFSMYEEWDGARSKDEVEFGVQGFFSNALIGIPGRKITISFDLEEELKNENIDYFNISLDWHTDVANMLKIISNKYYIDIENDWYSEEKLFITKYGQSNIAILCSLEDVSDIEIEEKIKFLNSHSHDIVKFIVAIKNIDNIRHAKKLMNIDIEYRYKNELLDSLVDFNEYFDEIKKEYENNEISYGDKFSIEDIYTESAGGFDNLEPFDESKSIESVEKYLLNWTNEKSNKQISLLGDYGQGKSVLSLKVAYEMIINKYERIPIIIELRGKSPKSEEVETLISSWATKLHINPLAIIRLMIEGKLLIILEGFDEMDMIGDSNRRLEHFNRLWEFARYKQSKVLITGRPNLFLDNDEMDDFLKSNLDESNLFYTESVYIRPFNIEKITNSLRNIDQNTKKEMIDLLNKKENNSFLDLMSRPSTLYQASIIWDSLDKNNINSASVIDTFLNHAYNRQDEKLRTIGKTGVSPLLTTNERKYFILGIAIGMIANNGYTNQINTKDLEALIKKLYLAIPDKISFDHNQNRSLKIRMKDNKNALDSIYNDIRASTILVRDLTSISSFKFAHKSFLEYLCAKYFIEVREKETKSEYFSKEYKSYIEGIEKAYSNPVSKLNYSKESIGFIVDMIKVDTKKEFKPLDILKFISPSAQVIHILFFSNYFYLLVSLVLLIVVFSSGQFNPMDPINIFRIYLVLSLLKVLPYLKIKKYLDIFDRTYESFLENNNIKDNRNLQIVNFHKSINKDIYDFSPFSAVKEYRNILKNKDISLFEKLSLIIFIFGLVYKDIFFRPIRIFKQ